MTIRRLPGDFVVRERLRDAVVSGIRPAEDASHRYGLFEVSKTSLTTPEVSVRLARALGVKANQVAHAGLKDKHAETTQHLSVQDSPASTPAEVSGPNWSARLLGWIDQALRAGHIEHNEFVIVVRDLTMAACREIRDRGRGLALDAHTLAIVNYFGDQRFGSARHGEGFAARALVRGDYLEALRLLIATPARKDTGTRREFTRRAATAWGDWKALAATLPACAERAPIESLAAGVEPSRAFASLPYFTQQMCVEAYQSALWNRAAAALVREAAPTPDAILEADDEYGVMAFPLAGWVPSAWHDLTMPLPGPALTLRDPWGPHLSVVLATEGLSAGDLRLPRLRRPEFGVAERPLLTLATGAELTPPKPDELGRPGRLKLTLHFRLPRGSYATVLLRALGQ